MFFTKLKLMLAAGVVGVTGAGVAVTRNVRADDPPAKEAAPTGLAKAAAPASGRPVVRERFNVNERRYQVTIDHAPLYGLWSLSGVTVDLIVGDSDSPAYPKRVRFTGVTPGANPTYREALLIRDGYTVVGPEELAEEVYCFVNRRRVPHELTFVTRDSDRRPGTRVVPYIYDVTGERLRLAYFDDFYSIDRPRGFKPSDQPAGSPPLVVLEFKLNERPENYEKMVGVGDNRSPYDKSPPPKKP